MTEYQYYEFLAIDRPLAPKQQAALRDLSGRAQITSTSFVNSYQFGDFKGKSGVLMETMFDLHLYWANWGTRRFAMRIPRGFLDPARLDALAGQADGIKIRGAGSHWVCTIERREEEAADIWDDQDRSRLAALAPIRADVMAGDLRVFYLAWLMSAEFDDDDEADGRSAGSLVEPMAGIGPLTPALNAFAEFFKIDVDLLAAAAERINPDFAPDRMSPERVDDILAALPRAETLALLRRVFDADASVSPGLRRQVRDRILSEDARPTADFRTLADLRARAAELGHVRAEAERQEAQAQTRREEAERQALRRARLDNLKRRGESVWREVDREISVKHASSYAKATALLVDLRDLATATGTRAEFDKRIAKLAEAHQTLRSFIARLRAEGLAS